MKGWKRERIIRVLLNKKQILARLKTNKLTKYRVSKEARCSYAWTHEFLKELEQEKLIKGTEIINARKLFDHWLKLHKKPKYREYHVRNPLQVLDNAEKRGLKYALTTYAAESAVQKYLFLSRYDLYVKDVDKWHEVAMESGVRGGGNFRILHDADPGVFDYMHKKAFVRPCSKKEEKESGTLLIELPRVSTAQLILDLLAEGGPCAEAAELLIKKSYGSKDVRKN